MPTLASAVTGRSRWTCARTSWWSRCPSSPRRQRRGPSRSGASPNLRSPILSSAPLPGSTCLVPIGCSLSFSASVAPSSASCSTRSDAMVAGPSSALPRTWLKTTRAPASWSYAARSRLSHSEVPVTRISTAWWAKPCSVTVPLPSSWVQSRWQRWRHPGSSCTGRGRRSCRIVTVPLTATYVRWASRSTSSRMCPPSSPRT